MFDTTNQTEASDTMAAQGEYEAVFDELMKEEENAQLRSNEKAALDSEDALKGFDTDFDTSSDEEDIFADYAEVPENQTGTDKDGRYRVIYNGREMYLTLDELKTNAQKGLNYDHVKGEYDILRAQPGAQEVLKDVRKSGLSPEAYLSEQKILRKRSRVESLMRRGAREKDARYMTDLEDMLETERIKSEKRKPFYDFVSAYPGVEPNDIPPRAWELYYGGMDLVSAYSVCENERMHRDMLLEKQNLDSRARSAGSAIGNVSGEAADPFLEGLMG